MGTFSGSVVEPAVPYFPLEYKERQKQKKIFAIVAIIEAVVIVGLAVGLVAIVLIHGSNAAPDIIEPYDGESEDYDFYDFEITDNESTTLRYLYALANNPLLNVGQAPRSVCDTIANLYNQFASDNTTLDEPCANNRLILATDYADSEYYPNPVLYKFSIVSNNKTYNLYADLDLRSFSYVDMSANIPERTAIIKISE